MKILVTGSKGFMGRNLLWGLRNREFFDILEYDQDTEKTLLDRFCKQADFVFHLAGVNRPQEASGFLEGNVEFTKTLIDCLAANQNRCPVMMASSIQAALDNPYGRSKKAAEELLFLHGKNTGAEVLIYRFPNVFGKWSRPDYNSAIATFCYNTAHGLPVMVSEPDRILNLVYIDDLVEEMICALNGSPNRMGDHCLVPVSYPIRLGELAERIGSFREIRKTLRIPDLSDGLTKKLYSTYLSYLPEKEFCYPLRMHSDSRGSFTEFIKTRDRGQVSVNIIKPGITKGDHWHHTKTEKFLIVSGKGTIRLRELCKEEVLEYPVCGQKPEVLEIPPGYTHNVENTGETDLVVILWANEEYDPNRPDTFSLEVSP